MSKSYVLAVMLLAAACPMWSQKANRAANDLEKIRKLDQADAAAAKTNDVEALTALWTEDGVLIQPMSAPVEGRANIHNLLQRQKQGASGVRTISYEEKWNEQRVAGGTAFEWGTITATLELPSGKQVSQTVYAARLLLRQHDDTWRFARAIITPGPRAVAAKRENK